MPNGRTSEGRKHSSGKSCDERCSRWGRSPGTKRALQGPQQMCKDVTTSAAGSLPCASRVARMHRQLRASGPRAELRTNSWPNASLHPGACDQLRPKPRVSAPTCHGRSRGLEAATQRGDSGAVVRWPLAGALSLKLPVDSKRRPPPSPQSLQGRSTSTSRAHQAGTPISTAGQQHRPNKVVKQT